MCHGQLYQTRIKNTFDRRVRPRVFKEGDLVLKKRLPNNKDQRGKWAPNYKGPYVVKHAFSREALVLADSKGQELKHSVGTKSLKASPPWAKSMKPKLLENRVHLGMKRDSPKASMNQEFHVQQDAPCAHKVG
ncbi:hypothetical protein CR513_16325, partial [Mucuna pruriens]